MAGPWRKMVTEPEEAYFARQQAIHEAKYLAGTNPRQQSGFGRDASDWERFRRPVVMPIEKDGSFLDIGCANGLLMESVVAWAHQGGHNVEPYGLDISEKLAELTRRRLPQWRDRILLHARVPGDGAVALSHYCHWGSAVQCPLPVAAEPGARSLPACIDRCGEYRRLLMDKPERAAQPIKRMKPTLMHGRLMR